MSNGNDVLVTIGKRDAWRLMDHCVTNYLRLCEQMGVKVDGKTVWDVRKTLMGIVRLGADDQDVQDACAVLVSRFQEACRENVPV